MTSLSFILTCRNAEHDIAGSVSSVLAIGDSVPFELVVVDDGSHDRTRDILRSFSSRSSRLRVLEAPSELGLGACRDIGAQEAQGDYLYYMDANEFLAAAYLTEVYREFEGMPDLVVGACLEFDQKGYYSRSDTRKLFAGVRRLGRALEYPACLRDGSCNGKFIRADLLQENELGFREAGNLLFSTRVWLCARDIRVFHKPLLVRDREGIKPTETALNEAVIEAGALTRLAGTTSDRREREALLSAYAALLCNIAARSVTALGLASVTDALRRHYVQVDFTDIGRFRPCDDSALAFVRRCSAGDFEGAATLACTILKHSSTDKAAEHS